MGAFRDAGPLGLKTDEGGQGTAKIGVGAQPQPLQAATPAATITSEFKPTLIDNNPFFDPTFAILDDDGKVAPGTIVGAIRKSRNETITFEAAATLNGRGCFLLGTIQNMLTCNVHADYAADAKAAVATSFRVSVPTPVRDHQGPNAQGTRDWYALRLLGSCDLSDLPGGMEMKASNPVQFLSSDRPGGIFPIMKDFRGVRLRIQRLVTQHKFITWLAARRPKADPSQAASYVFLHHVSWSVDRDWKVNWVAGNPSLTSVVDNNKIDDQGRGVGSTAPILVGPDALEGRKSFFDPAS